MDCDARSISPATLALRQAPATLALRQAPATLALRQAPATLALRQEGKPNLDRQHYHEG